MDGRSDKGVASRRLEVSISMILDPAKTKKI